MSDEIPVTYTLPPGSAPQEIVPAIQSCTEWFVALADVFRWVADRIEHTEAL